jgi:CDP-diglyceride synthetase
MRQCLAWVSTAPLMIGGLLAGHALGYRLAITDAHARADALAHSGHGYLAYAPLALTVCFGLLLAVLVLRGLAAFRGAAGRPAASPTIVLLSPVAFVVQEFAERLIYSGHVPWTTMLEPGFLVGFALQLPFALAALLIAWALDSVAQVVGRALSARPRPILSAFVPAPAFSSAPLRPAGLARGYGERAPPFFRQL